MIAELHSIQTEEPLCSFGWNSCYILYELVTCFYQPYKVERRNNHMYNFLILRSTNICLMLWDMPVDLELSTHADIPIVDRNMRKQLIIFQKNGPVANPKGTVLVPVRADSASPESP